MRKSVFRGLSMTAVLAVSACSTLESLDPFGIIAEDEVLLSGDRVAISGVSQSRTLTIDASGTRVALPPPASNPEWPQLNGGSSRNIGHVAAGNALALAWTSDAGSGSSSDARIVSPPIAAAGRIFTLDAGATVAAHDASSGARVWSVKLTPDGENTEDGFGGGVAFDKGLVYVSNGFGELHAISADTGEVAWTASLGAPSRAAPAVVDGNVFAVTRDNRVISVDATSGDVNWMEQGLEQSAGILGGAAPAANGQVVIAPFSSGELNAYSVGTGRLGWADDLTGSRGTTGLAALNDVSGDPVISDGIVYAASQSGRFVAVEARTGERLWTQSIGGIQPPYVAGDTIFFVSGQGKLVAMQKEDGNVIWATELGEFRDPEDREGAITWAGPILAGGNLLLTSDLGAMISVNPANGDVIGEVDLPGGATNGPIAAGGTVYVLTDNATLAAYR